MLILTSCNSNETNTVTSDSFFRPITMFLGVHYTLQRAIVFGTWKTCSRKYQRQPRNEEHIGKARQEYH